MLRRDTKDEWSVATKVGSSNAADTKNLLLIKITFSKVGKLKAPFRGLGV